MATLTWLLTYFRDHAAHRVTQTAALIGGISTSERLAESSFQVTRLINAGDRVSLATIDPRTEAHVVDMLDFYEFLCDLYQGGVLSRKTIIALRGRLMKRTWDVCERYVMETRAVQKRPIYEGFERFVKSLPFTD